ncbi:MAG: hypothetical protein J5916_06950 [Oscillospiraceae bacterium]|nr:hypothetical protein [Oscillospiraceae bacterium]
MNISDILSWLSTAPQLSGEKINWSFLPSYSGWSLSVPKAETRADILGNRRERLVLKITRRDTIESDADRLAVFEALEALVAWAKAHPPENVRLKAADLPEFTSRSSSGIEDISVTMTLERSQN